MEHEACQVIRETADTCCICGEEISSERQIAKPGTQMCDDCATDEQQTVRLFHDALVRTERSAMLRVVNG